MEKYELILIILQVSWVCNLVANSFGILEDTMCYLIHVVLRKLPKTISVLIADLLVTRTLVLF